MNSSRSLTTSKYKLSRQSRKLPVYDDSRIVYILPKDVTEKTWTDILQKDDTDLMIFEIREDIVGNAIQVCYDAYMERQKAKFTTFCTAQALLKLIDWHFYRHDPGEEETAWPACYIPRRAESWAREPPPPPAAPDTWARRALPVRAERLDPPARRPLSAASLGCPPLPAVPSEYWFPGKVNLPRDALLSSATTSDSYGSFDDYSDGLSRQSSELPSASEVLQKVTDYSDTCSLADSLSERRLTTPAEGAAAGGGDARTDARSDARPRPAPPKPRIKNKRSSILTSNRLLLRPLERAAASPLSVASDCRLRKLRVDTEYEVLPERLQSASNESVKKWPKGKR